MTAPDPRLDEIQAIPAEAVEAAAKAYRCEFPYDENEAYVVKLILEAAHPVLLAELRKAHEALERVEGVAGRLEARAALNARVSGTGIYDDAMQLAADAATSIATITATDLRAAVAAAKGDGE